MRAVRVDDFDYELPRDLIAQYPSEQRGASRLLHLDAAAGTISDLAFSAFPNLLGKQDVLIMNDTRVFRARLAGRKISGGRVEVMIDRLLAPTRALALVRASHASKPGQRIVLEDGTEISIESRDGDLFVLEFSDDILETTERVGSVPLPPYIEREPDQEDARRYQTVYARRTGAVAAPTAGLHFDQAMLDRLSRMQFKIAYVTLHVGSGTFQPVRVERAEDHQMHSEWYSVPEETVRAISTARASGGRVLAVGTTTLRALESAASDGALRPGSGDTRLFVRPGFRFRVVDRLLTNFHLPRSTLLMLVSAFAGTDLIRRAYAHAIAHRYRFFSYGDAMLIERAPDAG
jgi:S-adenosylmethionine:tRNA ribosyltransferase-isomerase